MPGRWEKSPARSLDDDEPAALRPLEDDALGSRGAPQSGGAAAESGTEDSHGLAVAAATGEALKLEP
jgi:hypothetical protein